MSRIMCDGVDITEHVAAMFDALVSSTDWGSGFLDDESIEGILTVGALAGFDLSHASPPRETEHKIFTEICPSPPYSTVAEQRNEAVKRWHENEWKPWNARKEAAIDAWRRQFEVKARALKLDAKEVGDEWL